MDAVGRLERWVNDDPRVFPVGAAAAAGAVVVAAVGFPGIPLLVICVFAMVLGATVKARRIYSEPVMLRRLFEVAMRLTTDPTVVRAYKGRTPGDSVAMFSRDAMHLAAKGYTPVGQSWSKERPGAGVAPFPGPAADAEHPNATLTVTYRFGRPEDSTKRCPSCGETVEATAITCRFCGHLWPSP